MFLSQDTASEEILTPVQDKITEMNLENKIDELNMRLQAQDRYKMYGLGIGVLMLILRLFRKG